MTRCPQAPVQTPAMRQSKKQLPTNISLTSLFHFLGIYRIRVTLVTIPPGSPTVLDFRFQLLHLCRGQHFLNLCTRCITDVLEAGLRIAPDFARLLVAAIHDRLDLLALLGSQAELRCKFLIL